MKRGQVSVYLIIGFVIIISIIGVFYIRTAVIEKGIGTRASEVSSVPEQLKSVKEEVKNCIDDAVSENIYSIAFTGGLYEVKEGVSFSGIDIPYLLINKRNLLPTKEQIQFNLAKRIESNINDYCGNIESAEFGVSNVAVVIENGVIVDINWPIVLRKGDFSGEIESFSFKYDIELLKMRNLVNDLINDQIKYYPDVCLSCLAEIAVNEDAVVERSVQEGSQIFLIRSNQDDNLVYGYAVKYE